MHELSFRTKRTRRGWWKPVRPLYETEVTDEMRVAYGRGPTAEASIQAAQRNWDAQFEITCWGTTQTTLTFDFYLRQHRCVLAGRMAAEGLVPRPRDAGGRHRSQLPERP